MTEKKDNPAVNDGVDSIQGDNDFTPFRNIINEWYAKDTSRKIRAVVSARGKSGKSTNSLPPYGFVFDEFDIDKWSIDEEAAKIVRRIYNEFVSGVTVIKIAQKLNEEKVFSPQTYKHLFVYKYKRFTQAEIPPEEQFCWTHGTVLRILDDPVYIGKIVNFRTFSQSFKCKKRMPNAPDKQMIFDNHHPSVIDFETWETVRKLRDGKRRPQKNHYETPLFAGFVYCADCGAKLTTTHSTNKLDGSDAIRYRCSNYSSGRMRCTCHYVREDFLIETVLFKIREVTYFAKKFEKEFVKTVNRLSGNNSKAAIDEATVKITEAQKRLSQLNKILSALFEDKVLGKISDDVFGMLSQNYSNERKTLEEAISKHQSIIKEFSDRKKRIDGFLKVVKSTEVTELTSEILGMFLDKVLVHNSEKINGKKVVKLEVLFKEIGNFDDFDLGNR